MLWAQALVYGLHCCCGFLTSPPAALGRASHPHRVQLFLCAQQSRPSTAASLPALCFTVISTYLLRCFFSSCPSCDAFSRHSVPHTQSMLSSIVLSIRPTGVPEDGHPSVCPCGLTHCMATSHCEKHRASSPRISSPTHTPSVADCTVSIL